VRERLMSLKPINASLATAFKIIFYNLKWFWYANLKKILKYKKNIILIYFFKKILLIIITILNNS
jgi:hypothetical protein